MEAKIRERLKEKLKALNPHNKKLLLMVSGGADSMVLLHFLMELKDDFSYKIGIFSLDHMFRGESSLSDLMFVKDYAAAHGIKFYGYRRNVAERAKELGIGEELCARIIRYNLASSISLSYSYDYILSAHHASDSVESMLMHLFRGSGLGGLKGIAEVEGNIVRPLLFINKKDILMLADSLKIPYKEDATNSENNYSRNFLRNEIIPCIERLYPSVENTLIRSSMILKDENDYLETVTNQALVAATKYDFTDREGIMALDINSLKTMHPAIRRRVFLSCIRKFLGKVDVYSSAIEEVSHILNSESGKKVEIRDIVIERERSELIIRKINKDNKSKLTLSLKDGVTYKNHLFKLDKAEIRDKRVYIGGVLFEPSRESSLKDWLLIDNDRLNKGVHLREREPEDIICPARLKGYSRSIKKLLNDHKIPRHEREKLIYLAGEFKILWILGIEKNYEHNKLLYSDEKTKNIVLIRAYSL